MRSVSWLICFGMGKKKETDSGAIAEVLSALARASLPPPFVDPIAWIESTRWLSPESSAEIGPFRFSRAPYLEEPQRAILDSSVPEIVLNWSSQCGKSELWLNALLYWSEHAPAPTLLVGPDWKSVKSLSADRIKPMMRGFTTAAANCTKAPRCSAADQGVIVVRSE
jgi:phage terminase large subunit GpA-like protein